MCTLIFLQSLCRCVAITVEICTGALSSLIFHTFELVNQTNKNRLEDELYASLGFVMEATRM